MTNIVVVTKILFLTLIAHSSSTTSSGERLKSTTSPSRVAHSIDDADETPVAHLATDSDAALLATNKTAQRPVERAPPAQPQDLCYLSDGGSSMTLAINEATPLGSVVGSVEVSPTVV